ncbi:hypothetical protein SLA2020_095410 [Shorea laevis]
MHRRLQFLCIARKVGSCNISKIRSWRQSGINGKARRPTYAELVQGHNRRVEKRPKNRRWEYGAVEMNGSNKARTYGRQ